MKRKWAIKILCIMLSVSFILPLTACNNKSKKTVSKINKYSEKNGLTNPESDDNITDDDIKGITNEQMTNLVAQYKILANNAMKVNNYLMEDPVANKENCEKVLQDMMNEKEEILKVVPDCLKEDLSDYCENFIKISQKSLDEKKYNHEDYDECDNKRYNFEMNTKVILDKLHMDTGLY